MLGTITLLVATGIVALITIWFASHDSSPTTVIGDLLTLRDLSQRASWEDAKVLYH